MWKMLKSRLFYFMMGAILFSGITAYAATTLLSKDIGFVPDNSSWEVNNVQDALNDLYENDTLYLPYYKVNISGDRGGEGSMNLNSEKYNTLTIDNRMRTGVIGTTYWAIYGYDESDCTGNETKFLFTTEPSSSLETFDISGYECIRLQVECHAGNGVVAWYGYYFNGISLSR